LRLSVASVADPRCLLSDLLLTQSEADILIASEKHWLTDGAYSYAHGGGLSIPLQSVDRREQFILDIRRGRIDLQKGTTRTALGKWSCSSGSTLVGRRTEIQTTSKCLVRTSISTKRGMARNGRCRFRQTNSPAPLICGELSTTSWHSAMSPSGP